MGRKLDSLHPNFRRPALEFLAQLLEEGIAVAIVTTDRSDHEHARLFASMATHQRRSPHQDGLAMDVCPLPIWEEAGADRTQWDATDPAWAVLATVAERCGLRSGAHCGLGHVELPTLNGGARG